MVWIFIVAFIVIDQVTKQLVLQHIGPQDVVSVIPGFFDLIYRENPGAAWSFLAGADWGIYLLRVVSVLAGVLFVYFLTKTKHSWLRWALALMIAGTFGNAIDRWLLGYVIDFLSFTFGSYVFPTFNVADSLLVVGTIAFAIGLLTIPHDQQFEPGFFHKQEPAAEVEDTSDIKNSGPGDEDVRN